MAKKLIDAFEAACLILGLDSTALPVVDHLPVEDQKPLIAHYKLLKVIQAKNKQNNDWKPDWTNRNQLKYYPWLWVEAKADNSGLGLSFHVYDSTYSVTSVGSRLCVGSSADAKAVFEEAKDLYEEYFLIK